MARPDEVRAAVAAHLGLPADRLVPGAALAADLGLDSFTGIELATALEDRFALRISDDELRALRTYGDLEALVLRKIVA